MKQLLFLLLFPCIALAQYTGNGNQKITLGEQSTADGLVFRGLAADTTRKPSVDTMAYILLDTNTNIIWQYKKATNNAWTRVGGSISSGVTGVLPVANGGTNAGAFTSGSVVFAGSSGTYTQDNSGLFYDNTNDRLGIGTASPGYKLDVNGTGGFSGDLKVDKNTPLFVLQASATDEFHGIEFRQGAGFDAFIKQLPATGELKISSGRNSTWGGNIKFYTDTGLRLTINSTGNVGIGTASPQSGYRLHVVDSIYVGGNVSASAYTTRSDYDLKDEIQNISYGINEVMQMQPVKYTYKSNGSTQLGFIAQDLGVITPEVVSFEDKMSVYYNALIPILTKAIQEQNLLIKALEQRLLILENK